jgi:capsular polysaccharide export protein
VRLQWQPDDRLVHWGGVAPPGVEALAKETGASLLRMEDGFVRSVGLGSDMIRPLCLVLDSRGIYFDPRQESGLERILNTKVFSSEELARAQWVREFMVAHGVTKYNTEPREQAGWSSDGRQVIFVPGQVEDDASVRFGCEAVNTNLALLKAARAAHPGAFIVYKPHPDVLARNRIGKVALKAAREFADHIETRVSVISCIEACDVVHTMTSLTGFDALLRGKKVVVHGRPFYAGWGLTHDMLPIPRRERTLDLDSLVAGAMLTYPMYWDWELKGVTTCEAVLRRIVETRDALEEAGRLKHLRVGYVQRKIRKAKILAHGLLR